MSIFRRRIWKDRLDAIRLYYKKPRFALLDISFGLIALFVNPYRVCRKFLAKRGEENIYAYGETPYTTYEKIAKECSIGPNDTWIELGAGRGKGCFWLRQFIGCHVIGIEWVPSFVFIANLLRTLFRVQGVHFTCVDLREAALPPNCVLYLYGLWPELNIPKGVKVITTGEPLEGFQILKSFWIRFPWGRTRCYLLERLPVLVLAARE
ncbi:MAG: hypothetical protein KGQ49_01420 [Verrucomicrobia bacterium]|nr:hypothetical protein [Verrucomicrobiota bacterium]MBU6446041.1 hypothetical protein [Verrucomicrobiota bacterium]MDE3048076.1 hypothetical protein [Verrucomicrobiota bacterium]